MVTDNSALTESLTPEESLSPSITVAVLGTDTSSDTSVSFLKPSRSPVWKYFHCQIRSAQCLLCKKVLSYNGGTTSNLIKHLEIKHKSEIAVQVKWSQLKILYYEIRIYNGQALLFLWLHFQALSTVVLSSCIQTVYKLLLGLNSLSIHVYS